MVFTRFVEIGRVAMINFGDDAGKLCVITNVLDSNRALVDGPFAVTGVSRQKLAFKRMTLTDFVVKIPHGARQSTIAKAMKEADVVSKFAQTAPGKKLAIKKARAETTDFDRFKLMVARKTKSKAVRTQLSALKKVPSKAKAAPKAAPKASPAKAKAGKA
jgi:large subunit ribosomal protein L14e